MKVYVAGAMSDASTVRAIQEKVVQAGFDLTLDWTQDMSLAEDAASQPDLSALIAQADLAAAMSADAVVVVASSDEPGRGMFVELGCALTRAELGQLDHVVIVGSIRHESVFYFHPKVERVDNIDEWLDRQR